MTWLLIGIAAIALAFWVLAALLAAVREIAFAVGRTIEASWSASRIAVGRVAGTGRGQLECAAIINRPPWPSPDRDSTVQRLEQYGVKEPQWPRWGPRWTPMTELATTFVDKRVTVESVSALSSGVPDCSPPYALVNEAPEFPSEPAPPKEPEYVSEDYAVPVLSLPVPPLWASFLAGCIREAHAELVASYSDALRRHTLLSESARSLNQARRQAWKRALKRHSAQVVSHRDSFRQYQLDRELYLEPLRRTQEALSRGAREGVILHFELALQRLQLPAFVPRRWAIEFDVQTKVLLLEHEYPAVAEIEFLKSVPRKTGNALRPVTKMERRQAVTRLQASLTLLLAKAIAAADNLGLLEGIAVNGWVEFFDKGTGHLSKAYCAQLVCSVEELTTLALETADPVAALARLRGACANELYDVAPTRPNLTLSRDDPRFVASRPTLTGLSDTLNLASMPWEDFEHLVRELFERKFAAVGSEVRITRASRDHGVDAVIFDSDPVRGGKIVVQAKRYTAPVDVSAVRDLYGTVVNEGANSGMLVTTSSFGPDAYSFAQNKPLKLFNGTQLLGLLEEVGYKFRIDLEEARLLFKDSNRR